MKTDSYTKGEHTGYKHKVPDMNGYLYDPHGVCVLHGQRDFTILLPPIVKPI